MRRNTPVEVYYRNAPTEYKPDETMDREQAKELVGKGEAMWMMRGKAIRLFGKFRMRAPSAGMPTSYAPGYDKIGIEKYPRAVVGGLVRTETQPASTSNHPHLLQDIKMDKGYTQVGVYYDGQSSKSAPVYFMDIETARSHKRTGTGHFINHGKAIRLSQRKSPEVPDNRLLLAGGSMRDSWTVMNSGGFLVWQMPGMSEASA